MNKICSTLVGVLLMALIGLPVEAKRKGCQRGGDCLNGVGDFYYTQGQAAGDRYQGGFKDGMRHGEGIYYFWNARRDQQLVAKWEQDQPKGPAVLKYPDGSLYIGAWTMGMGRHGTGKYVLSDGSYWLSGWRKDEKHGNAIKYDPSGRIIQESLFHGVEGVDKPTIANIAMLQSGDNRRALTSRASPSFAAATLDEFDWFGYESLVNAPSHSAEAVNSSQSLVDPSEVSVADITALENAALHDSKNGETKGQGFVAGILKALENYEPPSFEDQLKDRALDKLFD